MIPGRFFLLYGLLTAAALAVASPNELTYQGRILKSDGTPLEYGNVSFLFEITSSDGLCTIYREQKNGVNMTGSGGVFDVPIGTGTKLFPTDPTFKLSDAFNNSTPLSCDGGSTYTPTVNAKRLLKVQFHDGTGWKVVDPPTEVRSVPFAYYADAATKLGSHAASDFVLKSDVNNPGSGSVSCDSGNFLTWDAMAGTFGCSAVSGATGGTVTNVTASSPLAVTNGTSTPNITIQAASGSQDGYLSSSDWATFNNKLSSSTIFAGDISGTASTTSVDRLKGTTLNISSLSSNQVLKYSGGNWINSTLTTSDISGLSTTLSGLVAQSQFPASCAANQTLTFVSPSGSFSCSSIAINGSQVTGNISGNAAGFTGSLAGDVSGAQGATSVDKIKGVTVSAATPTANQVLTYAGGSWTPANLPSSLSGPGTAGYVSYYNTSTTLTNSNMYYDGSNFGIGTTIPTQKLDVNGNIKGTQLCIGADCRSSWPVPGTGTVTSITGGTGLTGGTITTSGTLAVDAGTTANKIVQLDSSAKLPAVDGSALINLNAANLTIGTLPAARMPGLTGDVTSTAGTTATTLAQIQGKALTMTSLAAGDFLKYNGTGWVNDPLSSTDLSDASSLIKSSQMPASCSSGQTLTFSSPTGAWSCSNIVVTASNFGSQTQNTFLAAPNGSNGTPTFRTIAAADLPGGTLSGSGTTGYVPYYSGASTLANSNIYNSGTSVGIGTTMPLARFHSRTSSGGVMAVFDDSFRDRRLDIISDSSGGDSYIGLNAHEFLATANPMNMIFQTGGAERMRISLSGNVGIGTISPTQTLDVNGNIKGTQLCIGSDCRSAWPGAGGGGTVTSITGGTGLTGGTITGSGTLAVDVGTTANKIVQLDSSAKLPAVDGSALTNLNAANLASGTVPAARMPALTGDVTSTAGTTATTLAKLQGKTLTATSPATGDYLKYNGTAWINDPLSSADLSDSSSLIKSSQMPANCAAGQTLTFSSPTGSWTCSNIVVTASNFGSQTQNTFLAAPNGSNGTPTFRTIASADLPSGTLSGSGTAGYVPYYSGASTLANSNIYNSGTNVGIGTTSPAASALLELNSTTKGLLPSRMTTAQRDAISSPAAGLTIFNTTAGQLQVFDGSTWSSASGSSTQEVTQASPTNILGGTYDILSLTTATGGRYLILTSGNTQTGATWTYFSSNCRLLLNGSVIDTHYFYYGGGQSGSAPGVPQMLYSLQTLSTGDIVKVQCSATSDSATAQAYGFKISLLGLGISNISGADNLGNHTATQNLNLSTYKLVGNGGTEGVSIDNYGNVGIGTTTPTAALDVNGKVRSTASYAQGTMSGTIYTSTTTNSWDLTTTASITVQNNDLVKVDLACNLANATAGSTTYMHSALYSGSATAVQSPNWITVVSSSSGAYAGGSSIGLFRATADGTLVFHPEWHVGSGTGAAVYCNLMAYVIGR